MTPEEVEFLFKHVTRSVRTVGVVLSVEKLTIKVFTAVDALLIERTKDAISKAMRPFPELFARHDANKDGSLEYAELENMLLECQLAFKPNMFARLLQLLDPAKKLNKINLATLRFFISGEASAHAQTAPGVQRSYDFEPSLDRASLSEETSQEEMAIVRTGARKIMAHFAQPNQKSLQELLNQRDKLNEGILSREDIQNIVAEAKVAELSNAELNIVLKHADRSSRGYICVSTFLARLLELTTETKQEATLRTFAMNLKRQGVNLKQELFKYDTARNGRLDKKTFAKALTQLPLALNDEHIELLFQAGESSDFRGALDIKAMLERVQAGLRMKAPLMQPAPKQAKEAKAGAFENWELEKKYQTKLKALQQQIEEGKKETQDAEKQARHWQEMANRFEKEKNALQARMVDMNAKPPRAA